MPRALLAGVLLASAAAPIGAIAAEAVTTPGNGVLTMCRNWVVFRSCKPYYGVAIPQRIAVGDKLKLTFGSNPKDYIFHVEHIRPKDGGCRILSTASDGAEDGERLDIAPCPSTAAAGG